MTHHFRPKKNLTQNDLYILNAYKVLKENGVTAYAIWKCSLYTKYPLAESSVKRIYKEESLPTKYDVYMGILTSVYNLMQTIKSQSKGCEILKKTCKKLKESELKECKKQKNQLKIGK